jgi:hypothetical protein
VNEELPAEVQAILKEAEVLMNQKVQKYVGASNDAVIQAQITEDLLRPLAVLVQQLKDAGYHLKPHLEVSGDGKLSLVVTGLEPT